MIVNVEKLTDVDLLREANSFTSGYQSYQELAPAYDSEHSPIRTQVFVVRMYDIFSFVSTHLVRHNVGVTHFVKSNRVDNGGTGKEDRYTPVDHMMIVNAQALMTMARARLCRKASKETRNVMQLIKDAVAASDPDLANAMVKECQYLGRCRQPRSCGLYVDK